MKSSVLELRVFKAWRLEMVVSASARVVQLVILCIAFQRKFFHHI